MRGKLEHHYIWVRNMDATMGLRCAHCEHAKAIEGATHYDISATTSDDQLRAMCQVSRDEHLRVCAQRERVACPPTPGARRGPAVSTRGKPRPRQAAYDEWEPA